MRKRYRMPSGRIVTIVGALEEYADWLGDRIAALGCSDEYVAQSKRDILAAVKVEVEA